MVANITLQNSNILLKNLNFVIDNEPVNCFPWNQLISLKSAHFFDFEEIISQMPNSAQS